MEINLEAINTAMASAYSEGFQFFGVRSMTPNPKNTKRIKKIKVGQAAPKSRNWVDGCATSAKLGGTCAIALSYCTIEDTVEGLEWAMSVSSIYDGQKCIVAGLAIEYGQDANEVILTGAKIIYVF
jgi:hypothetical protein